MIQVQATEKTERLDGRGGQRVWVSCAFCRGTGLDPFGIMSWLSNCCLCGGGGVVQVLATRRRYAHYAGRGAVKTFTCTVCAGRGWVAESPGPQQNCPECRGRGTDPSSSLACLNCRGRGRAPLKTQRP
jgi:DnaJ-class molecular chaperone